MQNALYDMEIEMYIERTQYWFDWISEQNGLLSVEDLYNLIMKLLQHWINSTNQRMFFKMAFQGERLLNL